MESISIKKATMINFITKYSNIFVQLFINSILARLLTPNDYGIVAIISVFISFFTIISDLGVGPAIIQYKDLKAREISDIFIFTLIVGTISSIGFVIFSYPLSVFYNNDVYISLGLILAISIFFNILNIVPNALLLKNKQFKTLGIRTVAITIIGGIITIILALNGAKYYALVINSVLTAMLTFLFNFYYSKLKIYFKFNMNSIRKIRSYSSYQFGFSIINYFSRNLDNLLIGKIMGQSELGYYDKAYKLMLYPVQNLTHVITPSLHPILSEYQENKEKIYNSYIKIVRLLSLFGVYFSIFCFFSSKEIIFIMFGNQWSESILPFRILSISIWAQMITASSGAIFQSTGKTRPLFIQGVITTSITIICLAIGLLLGNIKYIALFITTALNLHFIVVYYILLKYIFNKRILDFLNEFKASLIIAIIMLLFSFSINQFKIKSIIISVLIKFIVITLGFVIGLIITKESKFIKSLIKK